MRMIIVRHGESEWNRIHRYQGQEDASLSELGQRQAEALGEHLKHEPIDAIYTSALQRAAYTADVIARHHPNVPVHHDDALLEIHHGEWQGKFADEVHARYSDGLDEWRWRPTRSQMPGGESFSNVLKSSLEFKERMQATHAGQRVLVSTHDVVVKMLVADALDMNLDRINCIWIANASISIIEYGDRLPFLLSLGDACHLGALATTKESQKAL
jgi:probable phosphoglycerate mutase